MNNNDQMKYLRLLAEKYPTRQSVTHEIINLTAILNLPKGTEHLMSDLHGEYEAFCHILNNCSGVVREKVEKIFGDRFSEEQINEICTLIYYPAQKLRLLKKERQLTEAWYFETLSDMLEIARTLSSKYTRSKVRKAMPGDYAYIIDELLHAQKDEDNNQIRYHYKILETIILTDADNFVIELAELIKRLAVDHLHIVGDIFDRGESAEKIIDLLMKHHSLDIEWGNHDILWMGAACGSGVCIANVIRNSIHYNTLNTLEKGYGVSLRSLALFAERLYPDRAPMDAAMAAITVLLFKLEGQLIKRNPDFHMDDRLLLDKIDPKTMTVTIDGKTYPVKETAFPTVDWKEPYRLTDEETELIRDLRLSFLNSRTLKQHVSFLYECGGMYRIFNDNLLYHGCIPLVDDGLLRYVTFGGKSYCGKEYFDYCDEMARKAFFDKEPAALDFMWYLHCAEGSPLCGRVTKMFERSYIADSAAWHEPKDPYYRFYYQKEICEMILRSFGLKPQTAHIINGHTPVRTTKGELPIRADGKLLVIDGGFCKNYHETTGIAGYTLIYNSHGMRLKAHHPFTSVDDALKSNIDIDSDSEIVETRKSRIMVSDTDIGKSIQETIDELYSLLKAYRNRTLG